MARTTSDPSPTGDIHSHEYQEVRTRHVTSMDGVNPHIHIVPPWPVTRTLDANGHGHDLPERTAALRSA